MYLSFTDPAHTTPPPKARRTRQTPFPRRSPPPCDTPYNMYVRTRTTYLYDNYYGARCVRAARTPCVGRAHAHRARRFANGRHATSAFLSGKPRHQRREAPREGSG